MFIYNGQRVILHESVKLANSIMPEVLGNVNYVDYFLGDNTSQKIEPKIVADTLGHASKTSKIEIKEYWYWSKNVMGYYSKATPNEIYINTRALPRSLPSLVNTYVHEFCHYAGFSHGSNKYVPWKSRTVPYNVGAIAETICKGNGRFTDAPVDNNNMIPRPLWHRILVFWR
jgi:hypothetical protein